MQGYYGGLVCILMHVIPSQSIGHNYQLITQNGELITTQLSEILLATEEV
jgi:hypothetical protein